VMIASALASRQRPFRPATLSTSDPFHLRPFPPATLSSCDPFLLRPFPPATLSSCDPFLLRYFLRWVTMDDLVGKIAPRAFAPEFVVLSYVVSNGCVVNVPLPLPMARAREFYTTFPSPSLRFSAWRWGVRLAHPNENSL
jgi:hypothetical protein